jgi:hypothetical protein
MMDSSVVSLSRGAADECSPWRSQRFRTAMGVLHPKSERVLFRVVRKEPRFNTNDEGMTFHENESETLCRGSGGSGGYGY